MKLKKNMWSQETIRNVGIFGSLDGGHSQDALLHSIFAGIIATPLDEQQYIEVTYTLFRLFTTHEWHPARTFFYLTTGQMLENDSTETEVSNLLCNTPLPPFALDVRTINGDCDRKCYLLNTLWFDAESYYDDASSSSGSSDSESDSESDDFSPTVHGDPEDIDCCPVSCPTVNGCGFGEKYDAEKVCNETGCDGAAVDKKKRAKRGKEAN